MADRTLPPYEHHHEDLGEGGPLVTYHDVLRCVRCGREILGDAQIEDPAQDP